MKPPYYLCLETLSNPLRLAILDALRRGPRSVSQLARELGAERSRVSHALAVLRACSHVEAARAGRQRLYRLTESFATRPLKGGDIFDALDRHATARCNGGCTRLGVVRA